MDPEGRPLTWEYLFDALEHTIQVVQKLLEKDPGAELRYRHSLDIDLGLYDILPRLQTHPTLRRFIPYMGVSTFHWWFAEDVLLTLNCYEGRNSYHIVLYDKGSTQAEITVPIDEVIPTLLDYISRANEASKEV